MSHARREEKSEDSVERLLGEYHGHRNMTDGEAKSSLSQIRKILLSEKRPEDYILINEYIEKVSNDKIWTRVDGTKHIILRELNLLAGLEFNDFNQHLDQVVNSRKAAVYAPNADAGSIADEIISEIKGHNSFERLNDKAKDKITAFLDSSKGQMQEVLEKQKSRHANGGAISSLWNSFCQGFREIFMPETSVKRGKEQLDELKANIKDQEIEPPRMRK